MASFWLLYTMLLGLHCAHAHSIGNGLVDSGMSENDVLGAASDSYDLGSDDNAPEGDDIYGNVLTNNVVEAENRAKSIEKEDTAHANGNVFVNSTESFFGSGEVIGAGMETTNGLDYDKLEKSNDTDSKLLDPLEYGNVDEEMVSVATYDHHTENISTKDESVDGDETVWKSAGGEDGEVKVEEDGCIPGNIKITESYKGKGKDGYGNRRLKYRFYDDFFGNKQTKEEIEDSLYEKETIKEMIRKLSEFLDTRDSCLNAESNQSRVLEQNDEESNNTDVNGDDKNCEDERNVILRNVESRLDGLLNIDPPCSKSKDANNENNQDGAHCNHDNINVDDHNNVNNINNTPKEQTASENDDENQSQQTYSHSGPGYEVINDADGLKTNKLWEGGQARGSCSTKNYGDCRQKHGGSRRSCIDMLSQESVLSQLCSRMASIEDRIECGTSQPTANQMARNDNVTRLEEEIQELKRTVEILQRSSMFYAEAPFGGSHIRGYQVKVKHGGDFDPTSGFFIAPYDGAYQITVGYFKRTMSNTDELISVMLDNSAVFRLQVERAGDQRTFMTSLHADQSLWLKTNVKMGNDVEDVAGNTDRILFGAFLIK